MTVTSGLLKPQVIDHRGTQVLDRGATALAPPSGTPLLRYALVALDAAAVFAAWLLTYSFLPAVHVGPNSLGVTVLRVAAITVVSLVLLSAQRLYRARVCSARIVETARLVRVAAGAALFSFFIYQGSALQPSLAAVVTGGLVSGVFLTGTRGFYDAWLRAERARGRFVRRVAVIGRGEEAERAIDLLRNHSELGYQVCGFVGDEGTATKHGLAWLGDPRSATGGQAATAEAVTGCGASGVVLVTAGMASSEVEALMQALLRRGLHIQVSAGLWRVGHRRLQASPLAHEPFFYLEPPALSTRELRRKRALDLAVAVPILLATAPALVVVALAVKLSDRGPVLFRQTRIGRDGKPFTVLKFRTMVTDAEARLEQLRSANQRQGPLFKMDRDPRVTRVGRILRATSLDELPQLFNVLGGSMSMVGPRPALPDEVKAFDSDFLARHRLPPGVTGLWQIEARDNASFYAYRHLDLFYVENWSWSLDLVVMASTIPTLVARSVRSLLGRATISAEA